jgi:hypothetical protein
MSTVRLFSLPLLLVLLAACSDGGDAGTLPGGGGASATLTVKDREVTVLEDAAVDVALDVTASEGTPEVTITGQPAHGKLTGKGLAYTYTPAADYSGSDTVKFSAKLGAKEAAGTVVITVKPVNDAPSFVKGADVSVGEDAGPTSLAWATAVKAGPEDEAGQTVTFAVTNDNAALFAAPPAIDALGRLTFTPAADASGSALVTVNVKDDGGTADGGADAAAAAQTFTITVVSLNDAPTFTKGADATVPEDGGAQTVAGWATALSAGPANESGQTYAFTVTTDTAALFAAGPAVSPAGALTFTPAANAAGTARVYVRLADDGGTANGGADTSGVQAFSITVTPVNDAPSFAAGAASLTVNEDSGAYSGAWAAAVSAGPADEAAQAVTFSVTTAAPALFAVQPAISGAGTLTFTPAANANGTANLTVRAWDNGGTANGGANASGAASLAINVTAVNDAPAFVNGGNVTVLEDSGAYASGWATAISRGPTDEIAQAVTFSVTAATPGLFSVQPALSGSSGQLTFTPAANGSGSSTITVRAWDNGGTANGGANASAAQTFTITVTPVNDAPSFAAGGNVTVLEDAAAYAAAWATGISAGPSEAAQTVTFSATAVPSNLFAVQPAISGAGNLTFTPAGNFNGSATITVRAWDNGGTAGGGVNSSGSATFTITLTAVNDAPLYSPGANVTVNEDAAAYAAAWASAISGGPTADENSQAVTFSVAAVPSSLFSVQPALGGTGTLTFTPGPDKVGTATITVRAWDNGGTANGGVNATAPQTFTITLTAVNDAPSFVAGSDVTLLEDAPAYTGAWATTISKGPADEAAQAVTFAVSASPANLFAAGPAIDSAGNLTFTPGANKNGSATITVRAWDSGGTTGGGVNYSGASAFTINLTPVNDPPVFTGGASVTVNEDSGAYAAAWATGVAGGPSDELGQAVTFSVTTPQAAAFAAAPAVAADGTLTFTPAADAFTVATVSVKAWDNGGTANGGARVSSAVNFSITVSPVNDAPSFTPGLGVARLEDSAGYTAVGWATGISAGPANESAQAVTFAVRAVNPEFFSVQPALASNGTLTFTPAADNPGTSNVQVTAWDNGGTLSGGVNKSAVSAFVIQIMAVNDKPVFVSGADPTVLEDSGAAVFPAWAFAMDVGPADEDLWQTYAFTVTTASPAKFAVQPALDTAGTLTFTPAPNAAGNVAVYVVMTDSGGTDYGASPDSVKHAAVIHLTPVNDPPTFAKGPGQNAFEDAGPVSAAGWATGISTGPADEAAQAVTTFVVTDNPGLFAAAPTVALDGTLRYTPAPDKYGVANVTLRLVDSGGTANGGVAMSPPQAFSINVVGVNDAPGFTKGTDVSTSEDAAPQAVAAWATGISAGPLNESWQTVGFQVTTSTPTLFDGPVAVETDGTLVYTPAPNASGTAVVFVRAVDNGGTVAGGVNASPVQWFLIDVAAVNDAPAFTPGGNKYVLDTAGAQSFPGWATAIVPGPADESAQTYSFTVTNDAGALFTVEPALSLAGTLTFTPAVGASGVANVWVSMADSLGASVKKRFTLTVDAVNDAPTFTAGADVDLLEDAGAYEALWATNLAAGPAELGQALDFQITANSNPGLFAVGPVILADGTLAFVPAADANGTAALTVVLHDDGGTAGGGSDTSAPVTLNVTLQAVNDAPAINVAGNQGSMEDDPLQTRPGFATVPSLGAPDEAGQAVTFAVAAENPALFAVQPAIDASGALTWRTAPDANGTTRVAVVGYDNGGTAAGGVNRSAPVAFDLSVGERNDPPVLTTIGDFAIDEDDPLRLGEGMPLVTSLLTGPPDEAWQQFYGYEVTSSNPMLLGCTWLDGNTGWLRFCGTWNNSGTAVLYIKIRDDGGTANGGMDTTVTTVTVTVNPVPDAPSAQDDFVSTAVNTMTWVCVLCNDWDSDSTSVTLASVGTPAHGTATLFGGNVQYNPSPGYTGADTFSYSVSDGALYSMATVHVWVGPDVTPPHFVPAASRPVNGSVLNREQSYGIYPARDGALTPAIFVFDDPYLDRPALTYGVSFNGMPLVRDTHYWIDWMPENDRVGIRVGDNFPIPSQGGVLAFHIGNVKDTFGNLGSDVNVAVWWDPVAPETQVSGTWGVNARVIAVFSEPMSTPTSASLYFGVPSLGFQASPDPVNGEGWFSMAVTNDAYYFVPDAPFPEGVTVEGDVSYFTDLAGNRAQGNTRFATNGCCSNGEQLRLLSIRFVDAAGTTTYAVDLSDAPAQAFLAPLALVGGHDVVVAQFDKPLGTTNMWASLRGAEMRPNSLEVAPAVTSTVLPNDTLVFDPRSADPAFTWKSRDTFELQLDVSMASPSPSGGNAWYNRQWSFVMQAGPADVTAPTVYTAGALRGVGTTPVVRGEEPITLVFSEAIDPRDLVAANFTIDGPGGTYALATEGGKDISSVDLRAADAAGRYVALAAGTYTLSVAGLRDISVNANTSAPQTFPIVVAPAGNPAPRMLRFATPGTNVSLPLTFSFSDRMSPASFTDYGPPAGRAFVLEEQWGTTWIPVKGLAATGRDYQPAFPGNVVELQMRDSGLDEDRPHRLRWLAGATNIDGVAMAPSPDVLFRTGRWNWNHRLNPDFGIRGQEFVAGSMTFMGMPVESSLGIEARLNGGTMTPVTWRFTAASPTGTRQSPMDTNTGKGFNLNGAQIDTLFPAGYSPFVLAATDAAGQGYTIVGDLYRPSQAVLTDAQPVVTAPGVNGPGTFSVSGLINDPAAAARVRTMALLIVVADTTAFPPSWVDLVGFRMAQITRNADGSLAFAYDSPADLPLPALPPPYAYYVAPLLDTPSPMGADVESMAFGVASAPFNP